MKMHLQVYTESSMTNYPMTLRHIQAVMILNAVDSIQNGTRRLEAGMAQKELKENILKEYLEINMVVWDDNIKMIIKKLVF